MLELGNALAGMSQVRRIAGLKPWGLKPCRRDKGFGAPALHAGEVPVILGLNPYNGGISMYADLAGQIDAGQKKTPKIYGMAVHPTRQGCRGRTGFFGVSCLGPILQHGSGCA
jgi:hypothetical protein